MLLQDAAEWVKSLSPKTGILPMFSRIQKEEFEMGLLKALVADMRSFRSEYACILEEDLGSFRDASNNVIAKIVKPL